MTSLKHIAERAYLRAAIAAIPDWLAAREALPYGGHRVYFAQQLDEPRLIKIGWVSADTSIPTRIKALARLNGPLVLLGDIPGNRSVELELLTRFAAHHFPGIGPGHSEWFAPEPTLVAAIQELIETHA